MWGVGTASTPEVSTGGLVSPPTQGSSSGPCCAAKTVGNVSYTLVTEGTVPRECPLGCIYREVAGEEWKRFCFAPGNMTSSCAVGEG